MIELLAAVTALFAFQKLIAGRPIVLLIDSEPVEAALIKGYSSRSDMCLLTSLFWLKASSLDVAVYIDRVSTDSNIADAPSRGATQELLNRCWLRRDIDRSFLGSSDVPLPTEPDAAWEVPFFPV
jgi:hypothetical protein